METNISKDNFVLVGGACFGVTAVIQFIMDIIYILGPGKLSNFTFGMLLSRLVVIGLAVMLFMKKRNIGLIVLCGVNALLDLGALFSWFSLANICFLLRDAALFVLVLFACYPALNAELEKVKAYWFIPAVISAVAVIVNCLPMILGVGIFNVGGVLRFLVHLFMGVLFTVGVLILSKWLVDSED